MINYIHQNGFVQRNIFILIVDFPFFLFHMLFPFIDDCPTTYLYRQEAKRVQL